MGLLCPLFWVWLHSHLVKDVFDQIGLSEFNHVFGRPVNLDFQVVINFALSSTIKPIFERSNDEVNDLGVGPHIIGSST
jgi:hypothetical protein